MRQNALQRVPTLVVWACIGVGVVTFLWTAVTLGRPELLQPAGEWLKPEPAPLKPAFGDLTAEMRKLLARRVLKLQRDIVARNGSATMSGQWASELDLIAGALDPRVNLFDRKAPTRVCPEKFEEGKFVREVCKNAFKTSELLSVILPARSWTLERIAKVLRGLYKHPKMNIILIIDNSVPPPKMNVTILLTYDKSVSEGKVLNDAVSMVGTPFVLIGENLDLYSENHASLTRLIQVMDQQPSVAVVGGGYRDVHGQWRHGCIQKSITNYHATFIHGYEYSHQECMYCDDVVGPFVANTNLLTEEPFSEEVSQAVIYHDWFTTVVNAGYSVMVCPDAMFFIDENPVMGEEDWKEYGRRWSVVSIDSYDGNHYKFSCSDVHLDCNDLQKKISWFMIPPCCREIIMKGIELVDKFSQEHEIKYELHHGSLLGAIKLGSYLPWDFDQDIYYDCREKSIWQSMDPFLKENGANCHLRLSNTQTQLVIQCKSFFIDMVCRKPLSHLTLPEIYRNISTWIDYGGYRVSVMANPGASAREHGGIENLRHAQHWRVKNHPDPGAFRPCRTSHTSCLDRHPADGNFAFANPPVCLP
ncbi:uncharacterized protein LOC135219414 [Macrobrachium nipponense]|uniref:uncharacterized protein LOC135219414 n=1 Tax=Macrobrachium nipponense TaxID=159736 RepID=UPI0030C87CD2